MKIYAIIPINNELEDLMVININDLGFSQIYLSSKKIESIQKWFDKSLKNFDPIPVRDFIGKGQLFLTDGHTRTFVAWKNGIKELPVLYDKDEDLVTNDLSLEMYLNCINWCKRLKINNISDFSNRILSEEKYNELWNKRCDRLHYLVKALKNGKIAREFFIEKENQLKEKDLYIYGISKDLKILYCENNYEEQFEIRIK